MAVHQLFVRVRDEFGNEFDVPEQDWRINAGIFKVVKPKLYPPSPVIRRPKSFLAPEAGEDPLTESEPEPPAEEEEVSND